MTLQGAEVVKVKILNTQVKPSKVYSVHVRRRGCRWGGDECQEDGSKSERESLPDGSMTCCDVSFGDSGADKMTGAGEIRRTAQFGRFGDRGGTVDMLDKG